MGVVTSFDIEATELGDVVFAQFAHDAADTAEFLQMWGKEMENSPRELTAVLIVAQQGGRRIAQTYAVWAGDDTERAIPALERFLSIAPVLQQSAQVVPYAIVMAPAHHQHDGQSLTRGRAALVDHVDADTAALVAGLFDRRDTSFFQIRAVGGAINDVPANATAYAHRTQNFSLFALVRRGHEEQMAQEWGKVPATGLYLSFETHDHAAALNKAFPPDTLERLRRVKGAYDPQNVFRGNFPIRPTTA
ncbi:BBE domain-containing protein [Streptomyces sp. NPDC005373]